MDRIDAADAAGFRAVECQRPYSVPAVKWKERLDFTGVEMVLINFPSGDWEVGDRGIACDRSRQNEFLRGVDLALEYADQLNCSRVNCLSGIAPADSGKDECEKVFVENVNHAAEHLERFNKTLLLEAINTFDIPGFFLSNSFQAEKVIDNVETDNLQIQYDVYHMYRMEGGTTSPRDRIKQLLPKIGHIQISNYPGRRHPGSGEIDYKSLLGELAAMDYDGWIGCEYTSMEDTFSTLTWLDDLGLRLDEKND